MPSFKIEKSFAASWVAGVDEAGRGPLAGPVVAGAVVFKDLNRCRSAIEGLNDSKKLSPEKREKLFEIIMNEAFVGIGISSVREIDDHNILQATFMAMNRALDNLTVRPEIALIDGNHTPKDCKIKARAIIKGDSECFSIAAASVVAKVTRDRIMKELDAIYPQYCWKSNAGYGVKAHLEAIGHYGITEHHRRSFAPASQLSLNL